MRRHLWFVVLLVALLVGCGQTFEPAAVPPTATPEPTPAHTLGDTQTRPADGMVVVYVPAGEFLMGSDPARDEHARDNEFPEHRVYLDAFWFDQTEVTNSQYGECVAAGVCEESAYADDTDLNGPQQPVVGVDWDGAQIYCEWVGARLPTEAEWEYAARGPDSLIFPWGNSFDPTRLSFNTYDDGYVHSAPAGSFPSGVSWCGALNMAGNVSEWVGDWYDADYYATSPSENPAGPATAEYRATRGGSWGNPNLWCWRGAHRGYDQPWGQRPHFGFRCARPAGE